MHSPKYPILSFKIQDYNQTKLPHRMIIDYMLSLHHNICIVYFKSLDKIFHAHPKFMQDNLT